MAEFPVGLREVVPDQTVPEKCREFTIHTGGVQSTLQDIKVPDGAGGYAYSDSGSSDWTRNRFLEWRTCHDVLELVETSLDWNLKGHRVKFRFQDTPLLSGGVSVHETLHHVVILVATVGSVHKLVFPHPERLHKQDLYGRETSDQDSIPSILSEASPATPKQHFHILPAAGTSPLPHTAATWLDTDDEALFALGNPAGTVVLIKLGNMTGMVTSNVLKSSSYFIERFLGGFGGILSRGAGGGAGSTTSDGSTAESAVTIVIHPIQNDIFVFALCRDHKIRMWLASTGDCVMVSDALSTSVAMSSVNSGSGAAHAGGSGGSLQQGAQSHMMRKVYGANSLSRMNGPSFGAKGGSGSGSNFALAIFLCFSQHSQFCVFKPTRNDGQWQLDHLATVFSPDLDLIDFSVSPTGHLMALWTNPDGLPVLRFARFGSSTGSRGMPSEAVGTRWTNIALQEPLNPEFQPPGETRVDPRRAYLEQLFYPGRFSIHTLAKTVSIYRRAMDPSSVENWTMGKLKEEVCSAIEMEIHNQVNEYEITDEEHIEISHEAWAKFYSCAIQYHEAGLKPMGLVVDSNSGLIVVVKKSGHSFVRPVDPIEQLVLTQGVGANGPDIFQDTPHLRDDPPLANDVVNLMRTVALVDSLMTPALADDFERGLHGLISPDHLARQMVGSILSSKSQYHPDDGEIQAHPEPLRFSDVQQDMNTRLHQIGDLAKALEVLLRSLELDGGIVAHSDIDITNDEQVNEFLERSNTKMLFASTHGVSVMAESLKQFAQIRLNLARNIMLLQMIMLECGYLDKMPSSVAKIVHSTFLPQSVVMAHCYFVLKWLTETLSSTPPPNSLEQGMRQMAVLKISDGKGSGSGASSANFVAQLARNSARPLTLSELFLKGPGSKSRALLVLQAQDGSSSLSWHQVLTLVNISAQLLWPRCAVPAFQQFLLSACQHMQIQEYVRLLSTWCDWNCHSRQFLLGSALMNMGEPEKACDWMIQAAGGVTSDQFLLSQIFSLDERAESRKGPNHLTVLYFLKIIHLFEQFGYFDYVIDLARTAMGICSEDDENKTTLCYIMFSYHLKLGHNDEAYDAMVSNPDQTRRKDSLRQFVVTLFERKQLRQLANYPYIDMFEDLETIIESRARSVDLAVNNYYDFLYSFHVTKANYRKAAHVMYECGMRLGTELFTLEGLKRQAKCYLACLNCLKLVEVKNAWIVRPTLQVPESQDRLFASPSESTFGYCSPKRSADGEELEVLPFSRKKMEVLEMAEIDRDFQIVCARLKLANKRKVANQHPSGVLVGPGLSPSETVSFLVATNLYEDAVKIASSYTPPLDYKPIVEALTAKCVALSRSANRSEEHEFAWEWLSDNNPGGLDIRANTAVEAAWKLLENIIERLEGKESVSKSNSQLHKAVAAKLISLGAFLPSWLVTSYKKRDAAELLRLYMVHGYLEDASILACEYVSAVLGEGKEYFGLPNSVNANSSPVWLPYNVIDQILMELKDHSDDPIYKGLLSKLDSVLAKYLTTVSRVSQQMIDVKVSSM